MTSRSSRYLHFLVMNVSYFVWAQAFSPSVDSQLQSNYSPLVDFCMHNAQIMTNCFSGGGTGAGSHSVLVSTVHRTAGDAIQTMFKLASLFCIVTKDPAFKNDANSSQNNCLCCRQWYWRQQSQCVGICDGPLSIGSHIQYRPGHVQPRPSAPSQSPCCSFRPQAASLCPTTI